ncbi:hypothetical protein ACUOA8_59010, partial [Escherichia sp. SS-MK2]
QGEIVINGEKIMRPDYGDMLKRGIGNHHQQTDLINMATDKLFERDALALRQW